MRSIERLARIAGRPSPEWPGGKPVRQSARDRRIIYGQRTPAPRIATIVDPESGKARREWNIRTLDIARPAQTRGSSRIPDAQDIAHALGAVAAGSPDRDPNPLGVATLHDWLTGEFGHPWVPDRAAPVVLGILASGRRRAPKFTPRQRAMTRHLVGLASIDAYSALVQGAIATAPPAVVAEDLDALKVWPLVCETAVSLLRDLAEDAAREALLLLE